MIKASMKVQQPKEKFTSLKTLILQLQLSLELSQLQELLLAYSDFLLFFAEYSFLFETSPTETSLSQSTYTPSDTSFSTQDPARDGINWYAYCLNNPLKFLDPTGLYDEENGYTEKEQNTFAKMSGTEQLIYLKTEYKSVTEGTSLYGLKAAHMRNQLKGLMRLDDLFYGIDGDEVFMNETLREFLNTSETGENIYRIGDMKEENGWYKMSELGSKEHQKITIDNLPNVKYVNIDGREAVFDGYDNFVTNKFDKATFNYGESLRISIGKLKTVLYGFTSDSTHGLYDMAPYFRQMNKKPDYWISVPYNYLPYGWQKTIRGEEW